MSMGWDRVKGVHRRKENRVFHPDLLSQLEMKAESYERSY